MLSRRKSIPRLITALFAVIGLAAISAACAPQIGPAAALPVTPTRVFSTLAAPTRGPGCTVVTRDPVSNSNQKPPLPAPSASDWSLGAKDGKVTITAYCDFQSPGCAYLDPVLKRLAENHPDDLRVIYRHYPLVTLYDKTSLATQAAEAAGIQGKFWPMHDLLYGRQQEWSGLSTAEFQDWLVKNAAGLKLDVDKFKSDLNSPALVKTARDAYEQNNAVQMFGTPYLLIDGETYEGPTTFGDLDAVVALMLLKDRQFTDCPPMTIARNKQYLAILHTEKGDATLELLADKAPLAVNNFIFLARAGWFNGVTFHRVIPGFVAQAGDPTGTGLGGPGYAFDNEVSDLHFDGPGVVGMANAGPGSNGSQFFITFAATPHLDGGYTIFGRVISGMDVLQKLTPRDPSQPGDLPPGDKILSVEIQEK